MRRKPIINFIIVTLICVCCNPNNSKGNADNSQKHSEETVVEGLAAYSFIYGLRVIELETDDVAEFVSRNLSKNAFKYWYVTEEIKAVQTNEKVRATLEGFLSASKQDSRVGRFLKRALLDPLNIADKSVDIIDHSLWRFTTSEEYKVVLKRFRKYVDSIPKPD